MPFMFAMFCHQVLPKLLSQDQGFYEGRTDEHKSLPHFSFLLFKVDVVFDFWNLSIPVVVRIHLKSQQILLERPHSCACHSSPCDLKNEFRISHTPQTPDLAACSASARNRNSRACRLTKYTRPASSQHEMAAPRPQTPPQAAPDSSQTGLLCRCFIPRAFRSHPYRFRFQVRCDTGSKTLLHVCTPSAKV